MHPQLRWILIWQSRVTAAGLVLAALFGGVHAGVSALLGGLIGVLGGLAYVWRAIIRSGANPQSAYRGQVLGEAYKFAVTILLFAAVFVGYREVEPIPLFVTYGLSFVVYWAALLKQS